MSGGKLSLPQTSCDSHVNHSAFLVHVLKAKRLCVVFLSYVNVLIYCEAIATVFWEMWIWFTLLFFSLCFLRIWDLHSVGAVTQLLHTASKRSRASIKVIALGLKRVSRGTKLGESAECQKIWTGSLLLNYANVALAGWKGGKKNFQPTAVCWQNPAGVAEPNRTAATPPPVT